MPVTNKLLVSLLILMTGSSTPPSTAAAATTLSNPKRTTPPSNLPPPRLLKRQSTAASFLPQKYSVEGAKPPVTRTTTTRSNLFSSLFAGVGSGVLASIVCAPLDVLRTRLQVWGDLTPQEKRTGHSVLREIFQTEGWKGGFRGLGATLITVPLFWGLYFPLYNEFKEKMQFSGNSNTVLVHCFSAILAGAAADVVCNPMFVVRTRLQTEALHNSAVVPSGILQTTRLLYREGGLPIFWRGMTASLFGLTHVAVQFPLYEQFKEHFRTHNENKDELTPVEILLSSGVSKMCASLLTYPHEVVRSRMMDSRAHVTTLTSTMKRIYVQEGVMGFYSGLHISLIRVVPNCCITFLSYELLLQWIKRKQGEAENVQS